jgi:hypothetical protein
MGADPYGETNLRFHVTPAGSYSRDLAHVGGTLCNGLEHVCVDSVYDWGNPSHMCEWLRVKCVYGPFRTP